MADDNARELQEREEKAFGAKQNLDALCQEIALNFYPQRADFTTENCLGDEFAADLFDSEPLRCRRDLANARASMLRPRGQEWYRAETPDKDLNERPNVAKVLDRMNEKSRTRLYAPSTGFVRAEKEADHDIVTFGNSIRTVESEIDRYGVRTLVERTWHFKNCAWHDDMTGTRPDVLFRRFMASARHIAAKFGKENLHETIILALDKDPDRKFELCHVMMPAGEYDWYKKPPRGRAKAQFASIYYDSAHKKLLRERPSNRFRYVVDRWETLSGSQYGYSPAAWTALPDARGMQTMAMVLLEAGEKSLDPPLVARDGAFKSDIEMGASGITWVDRTYDEKVGPVIGPLMPEMRNIPIGIDLINRATLGMRDNWFLTNLKLPQRTEKTAYETAQLVEEYIRANIPLFEPWETGMGFLLDEQFGAMFDMKAFGDMQDWPAELSDADLEYTFSNPLQDAIKKARVYQFQEVVGLVAGAMEIDESAKHVANIRVGLADAIRGTSAPADWLADEDAAAQNAANAAQAQAILAAMGTAQQAADVVKTGSEAAANLQQVNQPAVDGSAVYGPA